jgi:hypothetical protein
MVKKPCPESVINAGAQLVKLRRIGEDFASQVRIAQDAVKAAQEDVIGSKIMQMGDALQKLADASRCEGLVGSAHDSLRAVLGALGYSEPTDAEITAILSKPVITPFGLGGGGGRGR